MTKNTMTIGGIVLILAILFGKNLIFSSPAQQIQKKLEGLSDVIQTLPQDSTLKKAAQISGFTSYFTSDVKVKISHPRGQSSSSNRADLTTQFKGYKGSSGIRSLIVNWGENSAPEIEVSDSGNATVTTTINVTYNGQEDWLNAPVRMEFTREEGSWKISSILSPP